jgi:hypothetical protein
MRTKPDQVLVTLGGVQVRTMPGGRVYIWAPPGMEIYAVNKCPFNKALRGQVMDFQVRKK